ncbi:MAG TPA: zf-HC2 domain-containing protein [Thermoanaerobaculia bacterium]|nr:zf-HC2 domain-containing protein [Thermoanaerobaculia bacterium]
MNPRLPTCHEVLTFLGDYLANELPSERRAEFERHLSLCDSCVDYLAMYEATIRMARRAAMEPELRVEDMPEDLVKAILEAVGDER